MFDWMETELPYVSVGIVVDRIGTVDRDHERRVQARGTSFSAERCSGTDWLPMRQAVGDYCQIWRLPGIASARGAVVLKRRYALTIYRCAQ